MISELIYQDKDFYSASQRSFALRHRRLVMSAFLLFSDVLAICIPILISIELWQQVRADINVKAHVSMILPTILFLAFIYHLMALYPAIGMGPVEELKRLTISTFFGMLSLITISFFARNTTLFSRAALLISWTLITVSVPLSRKVFRRVAVSLGLWGIPTLIVGEKESVLDLRRHLYLHPLNGFLPVLCISGQVKDIFPDGGEETFCISQIQTLIIVDGSSNLDAVRYLVTQNRYRFKHILLLFDEGDAGPLWFTPVNILDYMGLEVVRNLLNPTQRNAKRIMEIALIVLSTPILVFLFAVIMLLIRLDTRGPVFYKQRRVGLGGKEIWIWKFRTMVHDAEADLPERLKRNPDLQEEWGEYFKLKNDPRITNIGRLLRRTSLDELPQVWNVLKGQMSLIGPRPIVEEEIPLYGEAFEIYKQVSPGITGLWQISGRNDLPYQERVRLDVYYIQNWSIWLDVHILAHTILTTVQAQGAY